MDNIGNRINKLLADSDYTQKELADMAGVTEAAMSRYIKNERMPKADVIANIATALETTSDYLITGIDKNESFENIYKLVARSNNIFSKDDKLKLITLLAKNDN